MASDIKEIIKKGSKAKLIQLAIDSRQFQTEGLPNPILTKEEVEEIWDKAKEEGWDKELFRATYKAKDMEAQTLAVKGEVYEALFYLQMFIKDIQRVEILLDMLKGEYITDYNEKTEKYETVKDKTPEELQEDLRKAKGMVFDQLEDITYLKTLQNWGNKQVEDKKAKDMEKLTEEDIVLAEFKFYKRAINGAKMGFYLVITSKFAGYRLYRKEQYEDIKTAITMNHFATVSNLVNSLDHIDYLLEMLEEYKPEILEELAKDSNIYIPDREKVKEIQDYLEEKILTPFRQKDMDLLYTEDYLLGDIDKEVKEKVKEANKVLEDYVRYGK